MSIHPLSKHQYLATAKRYSSDKQDPISNEIQERLLTEFKEKEAPGSRIVKTWEDVGSAWSGVRGQLNEIYDDLKRHNGRKGKKITLLLLLNWSRFFRNMKEAEKWIVKFEEIGVEVNTVEKWFDHENPEQRVMRTFELYQAQKYSDNISKNIRRGISEKIARKVYCHNLPKRFYRRDYYEQRRYTIEPVEPAFSASISACKQILYQGVPYSRAHQMNGGEEVLGPLTTWRQMIEKPLAACLYKGAEMNMPRMLTADEHHMMVALFDGNKLRPDVRTTNFDYYPTHGVLRCEKCLGLTTTSRPKSYNGTYIEYQVCHHSNPRHYRVQADKVNTAAYAMVEELTLNANTTKAVMEETKKIAKKDKAKATSNLKRLEKELKGIKEGYENATLKNAMGSFSDDQLKMVQRHYRKKLAEVEEARTVVERYAEILAQALVNINDIGAMLKGALEPEQFNDFLKMTFPDGLVFDKENRIFRTSSMNAAFTRTGWQSGSYHRIKIGGALLSSTPPTGWRQTPTVRTIASDLKLVRAYNNKYKTG